MKVPTKSRSGFLCAGTIIGLFSLLATVMGVAIETKVVSMNDVCAPVQPGRSFSTTDKATFEAPWWAPYALKEQAFSIFCGDRLQTRLDFDNGNVKVSSKGKRLWNARAVVGLTVSANQITIQKKRGFVKEVTAPWSV
jgi:hypothetical protein